jgi:hypothetical protein
MEKLEIVDGRHYTDYVEEIKHLKRTGRLEEAEKLLLKLIEAVEHGACVTNQGVAPWNYDQLAIIYRKRRIIRLKYEYWNATWLKNTLLG